MHRITTILLALVICVGSAGAATNAELRDDIRHARANLQTARVADCREWRQGWRYPYVSRIPGPKLEGNRRYIRNRVQVVRDKRPLCHEGLWQCVHRHEGAWDDPNPLYYGGLQMGRPFAAAYGDRQSFGRHLYGQEGTPDNWSEREQIAVADGAHRENGRSTRWLDSQWPGTSSECGSHL